MKFKFLVSFVIIFIFISSCKKDTSIFPPKAVKHNSVSYMPLAVSNYWIYQIYQLDSSGTETPYATDSLFIQKDTVYNSKTYYVLNHSNTSMQITPCRIGSFPFWINDSSSFLIPGADPLLDPIHLNDTVNSYTIGPNLAVLNTVPLNYTNDTVPAGIFSGIGMFGKLRYLAPGPPVHSNDPKFASFNKFVPGVGICKSRVSFLSDIRTGYLWKLVRYHV